jgi:hypothetical protein
MDWAAIVRAYRIVCGGRGGDVNWAGNTNAGERR